MEEMDSNLDRRPIIYLVYLIISPLLPGYSIYGGNYSDKIKPVVDETKQFLVKVL